MLKAAGRGHVECVAALCCVVLDDCVRHATCLAVAFDFLLHREVRSYVSRGCNANAGDGVGWSCVHHAAEYGRVEVIKELQLLLGMELDIDAPDNHGWYVL